MMPSCWGLWFQSIFFILIYALNQNSRCRHVQTLLTGGTGSRHPRYDVNNLKQQSRTFLYGKSPTLVDALVFIYLLCVTKRKNVWTNIVLYTVPLKTFSLGWPGGVRPPTGGSARLGGVDEEISQKGNICDRQKVQLFTYTINYPQQPKTVLQSRTSIWWRWMRIWWIKFGPTGEMSVNY